jgi:tripartite-type tricarboxylate transporter receptor subunit TctC
MTAKQTTFRPRRLLLAAGIATLAMLGIAPAHAEDWPARPVKIVVPWAPGGVTDMLARLVAVKLTASMQQPFIVENRPGAGGLIGSALVANAAPDGYTLVASGMASHIIAPNAGPASFDPIKSFTHIADVGGPPLVLVVHPKTPVKDVKEFIAYANAQAGGLSYGSPGAGTHNHMMGEYFRTLTKTKMVHVSYKGGGPAVMDLLAGHIPAAFITLSTVAPYISSGKLRLLAITSPRRLPQYPTVPTFAEMGYKQMTTNNWSGISGPAKLPPDIVNRLNAEIQKALAAPDVQEKLRNEGIQDAGLSPAEFNEFFRKEVARWTPLVKQVTLSLQK